VILGGPFALADAEFTLGGDRHMSILRPFDALAAEFYAAKASASRLCYGRKDSRGAPFDSWGDNASADSNAEVLLCARFLPRGQSSSISAHSANSRFNSGRIDTTGDTLPLGA
jgi:hypothetical protein